MSTNLSDKLIPNLQKSAIGYLIGNKRSGKSLCAMSILHRCLTRDYFHDYILVLPVYKIEQKGSYDWIDSLAKEKKKLGINVFIMEELQPEAILKLLIDNKKNDSNRRTLITVMTPQAIKVCSMQIHKLGT